MGQTTDNCARMQSRLVVNLLQSGRISPCSRDPYTPNTHHGPIENARRSIWAWKYRFHTLYALVNPPVPGIQIVCTDLGNRFQTIFFRLIHSIWEQENVTSDIEASPAVMSIMISVAKALRFDENWINIRDGYSEDAASPWLTLEIPAIPPDEKNEVNACREVILPSQG